MGDSYIFCIDESGTHAYNDTVGDNRFLCVHGCWMSSSTHEVLSREFRSLKKSIFPNHDPDRILLQRKNIIGRSGAFGELKNEILKDKFDQGLLKIISDTPFTVMSVIIDKTAMIQTYTKSPVPDPYCLSLIFMLERYCMFLSQNRSSGVVIAEQRNAALNRRLNSEYKQLFSFGSKFHPPTDFTSVLTSNVIIFGAKEDNIAGLQLADLTVSEVRKGVLAKRNLGVRSLTPYQVNLLKILRTKLYKVRIQHGVKFYPDFGNKKAPISRGFPPTLRVV